MYHRPTSGPATNPETTELLVSHQTSLNRFQSRAHGHAGSLTNLHATTRFGHRRTVRAFAWLSFAAGGGHI
jgi:hypothetical protein